MQASASTVEATRSKQAWSTPVMRRLDAPRAELAVGAATDGVDYS
jgi:hypothetical protein